VWELNDPSPTSPWDRTKDLDIGPLGFNITFDRLAGHGHVKMSTTGQESGRILNY
jgi:hypothetical protein